MMIPAKTAEEDGGGRWGGKGCRGQNISNLLPLGVYTFSQEHWRILSMGVMIFDFYFLRSTFQFLCGEWIVGVQEWKQGCGVRDSSSRPSEGRQWLDVRVRGQNNSLFGFWIHIIFLYLQYRSARFAEEGGLGLEVLLHHCWLWDLWQIA